jgi:hypothetical protein
MSCQKIPLPALMNEVVVYVTRSGTHRQHPPVEDEDGYYAMLDEQPMEA